MGRRRRRRRRRGGAVGIVWQGPDMQINRSAVLQNPPTPPPINKSIINDYLKVGPPNVCENFSQSLFHNSTKNSKAK